MRIDGKVAASLLTLLVAGCSANARFDVSEYQQTGGTKPVTTAALPQQDHRMASAPSAENYEPAPYTPPRRAASLGWNADRPETGASNTVHIVREGDTLYGLAKRYNVPMTQIYSANGLMNDRLSPGQHLAIPRQAASGFTPNDNVVAR